jgi:hypothetical protein
MPSRAATFRDVTVFNARTVGVRDYRRAVVGGAVLGLGSAGAVAMMAGTAAVAAAWLVAGSLAGNPALRAAAPSGLEIAAMPPPPQRMVEPADMFGSALASANPAYDPEEKREAGLTAPIAASLPAPDGAPQSPPVQVADLTFSVALPSGPQDVAPIAPIPVETEIFRAPAVVAAPAPPPARIAPRAARPSPAIPRAPRTPHEARGNYQLASVASAPPAVPPAPPAASVASQKPATPQLAYNNPDSLLRPESHTAIYDIVAHTVYLPDGERLEAHSGLGRALDDPRYVAERGRGATPPNTYDLTLRGELFHGVQAIRLNPVADSKMFGRDGILAHTYMLGPSGQSFGCVSFRDYPEFLHAFQRGEVDRLVVVPHLPAPPSTARARRDDGNRYAFNR